MRRTLIVVLCAAVVAGATLGVRSLIVEDTPADRPTPPSSTSTTVLADGWEGWCEPVFHGDGTMTEVCGDPTRWTDRVDCPHVVGDVPHAWYFDCTGGQVPRVTLDRRAAEYHEG